MASFDDGIEKMLWPEKREGDFTVITRSGKTHPGLIDRTTEPSYLRVDRGYLPDFLQPLVGPLSRLLPWLFGESGVDIGPIPTGTPINLLSNIDMEKRREVLGVLLKAKKDLKSLPRDASDEQARAEFADLVDPLLAVNKCPDFVVNKGHYFGTDYMAEEPGLSDSDKQALIAYLKTL
ncbi:hypothetical protein [Marinobacterium aestuariivivens]|uniref:Cytochrome c domain-containing protein n=1 Tax=Marinobacterium aestuariivivens TaxID=1698799 RepID=A0ABW2A3M8_9GAMM